MTKGSTRYIWHVRGDVPPLGVRAGDQLIYDPAGPDAWIVHRSVRGARLRNVDAAVKDGSLELALFPPGQADRNLKLIR